MLPEYQAVCPECRFPKAFRTQPPSPGTRFDCPKCGLVAQFDSGDAADLLAEGVYRRARERATTASLLYRLRAYGPAALYVVVSSWYLHDMKTLVLLSGMFLMTQVLTPVSTIENQLRYVLRLLQHRMIMDEGTSDALLDEPTASALLRDFDLATQSPGGELRRNGDRCRAYALWLHAALRANGCSETSVSKELASFTAFVKMVNEKRLYDAPPTP